MAATPPQQEEDDEDFSFCSTPTLQAISDPYRECYPCLAPQQEEHPISSRRSGCLAEAFHSGTTAVHNANGAAEAGCIGRPPYSMPARMDSSSNSDSLTDLSGFSAPVLAPPLPSQATANTFRGRRITRISADTAAALSSQQVVIDLRSICKELVENSLDAGATAIEVRLMDCGLGGVEVRDNGCGISPEDLDLLGCRHATSKITTFDDVYGKLDSLGFRGEALSSLCYVARVSLVTRCRTADFGTRLIFDNKGKQLARDATAREVGTTVVVEDIFGRMPLRRRTMEQTKQRQLQDALALMQRIALLHATVCRIVLSNFDPKTGGRTTFLATKGTSSSLLEAALSVYGPKQLAACTELTLSGNDPGREWRLEAVISRPPHGIRSAALQHFFVKRRAVEFPPLLQKLLNKKWKEVSSRGLFPVCLGFLELDASLLDINMRKDKQQVLIAVEKEIAQALLEAISKILAPSVGSLEHDAFKKQRQLSIEHSTLSSPPAGFETQQVLQHPEGQEQQSHQQSHQAAAYEPSRHERLPMVGATNEAFNAYDCGIQLRDKRAQLVLAGADCRVPHAGTDMEASKVTSNLPLEPTPTLRGMELFTSPTDTGENEEIVTRPRGTVPKGDFAGNVGSVTCGDLPLGDALQHQRPLLSRRQHRATSAAGDLRAPPGFPEKPEQHKSDQRELPEAHLTPNSGQIFSPQHCNEDVPKSRTNSADSLSVSLYTEVSADLSRTPPPDTEEETDMLVEEILEAAVGECHLDLEETCSVRIHGFPAPYRTCIDHSISYRDKETASTVGSQLWLDAPANFSLDNLGLRAADKRTDSDFFLFEKDFFSDLMLVGQFNEGFIIAALRRNRRRCLVPQITQAREYSNSTCNGKYAENYGSSSSSREVIRKSCEEIEEVVTSLFIVDQHASDEKRIFEALNADFHPRMQPLIAPLKLSLPADLLAAVDAYTPHLSSNGFACVISGPICTHQPFTQSFVGVTSSQSSSIASTSSASLKSASQSLSCSQQPQQQKQEPSQLIPAGARVTERQTSGGLVSGGHDADQEERYCFLTCVPVIEGKQLGASDFIEFLSALASEDQGKAIWKGTMPQPSAPLGAHKGEPPQSNCPHHRVLQYRPSRVWDILASKACRSAVMIGDPLPPHRQLAILRRMADLQLPFNCPHGRPTMRHLVDLGASAGQANERLSNGSSRAGIQVVQPNGVPLDPPSCLRGSKNATFAPSDDSGNCQEGSTGAARQKRRPSSDWKGMDSRPTKIPTCVAPRGGIVTGRNEQRGDFCGQPLGRCSALAPPTDEGMPSPSAEDEVEFEDSKGLEIATRRAKAPLIRESLGGLPMDEAPVDEAQGGLAGLRLTFIE